MYKLGEIIPVTVTSIVNYGVFVKANEGFTGLIHISEINGDYIQDINKFFKEGSIIDVKIIGIDKENMHLSLSTKRVKKSKIKKKKNNLKESGLGFDILRKKLPEWIDETIGKINNKK